MDNRKKIFIDKKNIQTDNQRGRKTENPMALLNPDWSIKYVNPAMEDIVGYKSEDIIGTKPPYPWQTQYHLPSPENFPGRTHKMKNETDLYQSKNGRKFEVKISSKPIYINDEFVGHQQDWEDIDFVPETSVGDAPTFKNEVVGFSSYDKHDDEYQELDMEDMYSDQARPFFAKAILEDFPFSLYITDCEGSIISFNDHAEEFIGIAKEDAINSHCNLLVDDSESSEEIERVKIAMHTGKWNGPRKLVNKRGGIVNVESNIIAIKDKDDGLLGVAYIDRPEMKRTKQIISLENGIEYSKDLFFIIDTDGNIVFFNKKSFNGKRVNTGPGRKISFFELFNEKNNIVFKDFCQQAYETNKHCIFEFERQNQVFETDIVTIGSGETTNLLIRIADISAYRNVENRLKKALALSESEKLKKNAIIESLNDALTILDEDFRIIYQNRKFKQLFGEYLGHFCFEPLVKGDSFCEDCPASMSFSESYRMTKEINMNGETKYFEFNVMPYKDTEGKIIGVIEIVRDIGEYISDKEYARSELKKISSWANQEIARNDKAHKTIHTKVNTDLKGALCGIKNAAKNLLGNKELKTKIKEDISALLDSLGTAESDIRRLSSSLWPKDMESVGLVEALKVLCDNFAKDNYINIHFYNECRAHNFGEKISIVAYKCADEALNNIRMHSGATEAAVSLKQTVGELEIVIKDNGSGFADERAINSPSTFGLMNIKRRLNTVGGRVRITSEKKSGVTIRFSIPFDGSSSNIRINILLADESSVFRKGLKNIFADDNRLMIHDEVSDESSLLEKFSAKLYDIVLFDLNLPGRNPADIIGDLVNYRPEIKILALSNDSDYSYARKLIKKGASGIIGKNESPEEIIKAVYKIASGKKYEPRNMDGGYGNIPDSPGGKTHDSLSKREYQVMIMLGGGKRAKDISDELGLSAKTIATYKSRIIEKMNFEKNSDITEYCVRNGLI